MSKHNEIEIASMEHQQWFRLALAQAAVGLAVTDANGRFLEVNQAFCELTGYTARELYRLTYLAITHPDDRQSNLDLVAHALATGVPHFVHQKRYVHKSGKVVWVRNSISVVRNSAGDVVNGIGLCEDITEQQQALADLDRSRAEAQALYEHAPVMMCTLDHHGRIAHGNHVFAEFAGRTDEEMRREDLCQALGCLSAGPGCSERGAAPPGAECRLRRAIADTLTTGRAYKDLECRATLARGSSRRDIVLLGSLVPFPGAHRFGALLWLQDISARVQTEAALRASEAALATTQRIAHTGSWHWDIVHDTAHWSDETFRMFGLASGAPLGTHRPIFLDLVRPDDRDRVGQALTDAVAGVRPYDVEYRIRRGDGAERVIHAQAEVVRDPDGRPLLMHGTVHDVTDRTRAEDALRESEARLRALFEHSTVGILLTAPDGRVFAANPEACRQFGRTEADICRVGRSGLVDPRDPRLEVSLALREAQGFAEGELTFVRGDGTTFPAQVASAVYESAEGRRTAMVIQDLSGRKRAEERVHEFSRRLLSVREEEKRELSVVLHHDVGSLTVGIGGRLLAAEEDLRAGKTSQALAAIKESRRLFAHSVKRLKALAVDLRPPDLDLLGLSAALRHHLVHVTHHTALRIRFTDATRGAAIAPDIQTVLFRAAQEALNNVLKHADARQVRVRLAASKDIRLVITDDGHGFDRRQVAAKPGTRLGLRAIQEMAEGLGGALSLDSAPGKGTTLAVTFPPRGSR